MRFTTKILKRFSSNHNFAFAFDIDGVLIQGKHVLPQAIDGLQELRRKNIPFIIITNGGGVTESEKAASLSSRLQVPIEMDQMCLAHSPMRSLLSEYRDKMVLVVGPDKVRKVAENYGFNKFLMPQDIFALNHHVWPFIKPLTHHDTHDLSHLHFSAILMMHDSTDWGRDMQIMYDALRSSNGKYLEFAASNQQALPIYFSHSDLVWKSTYPNLRFGQGSFRSAFSSLYHELSGHQLKYETFGKPTSQTFQYAETLLKKLIPNADPDMKVYMIGDNPESDIVGANRHGWESVLVTQTGVYREEHSKIHHGAKFVYNDVGEAIQEILRMHV